MNLFLTLAFLFCIGSVLGWGLEVIFRRFFSAHHWVNPGFLVGPYLPLYGSSLCVLYLLAMLEPLMPGDSPWLKKILLFAATASSTRCRSAAASAPWLPTRPSSRTPASSSITPC